MSSRIGKQIVAGYTKYNSYKSLSHKPRLNNVELDDNLNLQDLGIQPAGNYLSEENVLDSLRQINGLAVPNYGAVEQVELPFFSETSGVLVCNLTLDQETVVHIFVNNAEIYTINNFGTMIAPHVLQIPLVKGTNVFTKVSGLIRYQVYRFIPY